MGNIKRFKDKPKDLGGLLTLEQKIKWAKLKQILQTYLGESVDIICTTEFSGSPNTIFGFVGKGNNGAFKIVLNINEVKTLEDVIDVLAHESAHIVTLNRKHDEGHDIETEKIKKVLKDGY